MKKMNASVRQEQILALLSKYGAMKTLDLAEHFQVSRETLRRDLVALTEKGLVQKCFGGVISCRSAVDTAEPDLLFVKKQIAEKALSLIPPNSIIFMDNGTTTIHLAGFLSQQSGYTFVTPSLSIANTCAGGSNKLIICGGMLDPNIMSTYGTPTAAFLEQLKLDVAVFATTGFKNNDGPTGDTFEYCQLKTVAHRNAQLRIVLADSSKGTYSSLIQYANWKDIDYLITDSGLDPELKEKISQTTQIIYADM